MLKDTANVSITAAASVNKMKINLRVKLSEDWQ